MLRLIHSFSIRPGIDADSFINWLDAALWEKSKPFGCLERKTWIFLDGIEGTYETGKPARRPRYLNEAFWVSQQAAEEFRKWLVSPVAADFRRQWFANISDHSVLRYVDYSPERSIGDD